jgi:hypothetical protein
MADAITVKVAKPAKNILYLAAPININNSPIKLPVKGNPKLARVNIKKLMMSNGII